MTRRRAVPGMVLDSNGEFCIVVVSDEAVGVSIQRFNRVLHALELHQALHSNRWMAVYREHDGEIFIVSNKEEKEGHVSASEQESGQIAIEIALGVWPGWKSPLPDLKLRPKPFIPYNMKAMEV